ncbi:MAG: hypothetical protein V4598_13175 [Bdellovibrionota bacterium]
MKKVIAVAVALMASTVQASSGLDFGDLNFFQKSGQFNLTSNVSVTNAEIEDEGTNSKFERNGYIFDNRLAYGLADNLNVFVGLDYAFDYKTELRGSSRSKNDGISNPRLGANYRVMNQSDSAVNLDFGVVADIRLQDAEDGIAGEDGQYNRGNHSLQINSSIGRKWNEANEWRVTVAATQQFEGETEFKTPAGNTDIETDASTDLSLTAAYQYRPVQEFMLAVAGQAIRVGEVDSKNKGAGTDSTAEDHMDYNFTFSAKYLITETFIAKFNYGISRLAEYDVETSGTDSEQADRQANFYGWGIDWLF